jgi:ABC-2 type transport system ATP-binding protein
VSHTRRERSFSETCPVQVSPAGTPNGAATISIRNVRKSYGDIVAVDDVDLDLQPGEILGLIGPNGAGKTTLVSMMAGVLTPDAGSIRINGLDFRSHRRELQRSIGLAPQELAIYPVLTVDDNLSYVGRLHGLKGSDLRTQVDRAAQTLDLTHKQQSLARTLSGGEKRRLHTAMALVHRPRLALLDEPTAGVDVQTRRRLLSSVIELARANETAICYSSHYLEEVEALGATIAIIKGGRILAHGQMRDIVSSCATATLELTFAGSVPALDGYDVSVDDRVLRVYSPDPSNLLAELLPKITGGSFTLRSVRIIEPTLESAYLRLMGEYESRPTRQATLVT